MSKRQRADLAMVVVSLLWGVTFPLIRSAMAELNPFQFVGWRFAIACLAFLPIVLGSPAARAGLKKAMLPGAVLGLLAWASYFSQTIGLETIPAGRAAFITGTNVVMVPLLAPLFRAGKPSLLDGAAAILATFGLYLLTLGEQNASSGFSVGDVWVLLCAFAYAIYILVLQRFLRANHESRSLAFTQIFAIALFADALLVGRGDIRIPMSQDVLVALGVCAGLATCGTFWLQTRFQGDTTPQRVALIFALEPVFATGFAWWLLGERMGWLGAAGAALVMGAVLGVELLGNRSEASQA